MNFLFSSDFDRFLVFDNSLCDGIVCKKANNKWTLERTPFSLCRHYSLFSYIIAIQLDYETLLRQCVCHSIDQHLCHHRSQSFHRWSAAITGIIAGAIRRDSGLALVALVATSFQYWLNLLVRALPSPLLSCSQIFTDTLRRSENATPSARSSWEPTWAPVLSSSAVVDNPQRWLWTNIISKTYNYYYDYQRHCNSTAALPVRTALAISVA